MNNQVSIVHISDTHNNYQFKVGTGDILIHSGDATSGGTLQEIKLLRNFFEKVSNNFKHILFTPGNHDILFEDNLQACLDELSTIPNLQVVINDTIEIENIKIFLSPFSKIYNDWAFMDNSENLIKIWDKIPTDVDVVVTHGPAFGILDYSPRGENTGCSTLRYRLEQIKPKAHLFGHIHECWGLKQADGLWYVNSALGPNLYGNYEKFAHKIIIDQTTKQILEISDVE